MTVLARLDKRLARAERILAVLLYGMLAAAVVGTILTRNFFGISLPILLEGAPMLVLWLTLVGASLALAEHRHIRLEALVRYCPSAVRRWAFRFTSFFGAVLCGVLFVAAVQFVLAEIAIFGSKGIFTVVFPIFFFLATLRLGIRAIGAVVPHADIGAEPGEAQ